MPPDFVVLVIWHQGSYHNYPKPHCSSQNEVESVNCRWTASYWEGKNIALTMKGFMYRKSSWAMLSLKAINCAIKKLTLSLSLFSSFVQGLCLTGVEWKWSGNWVLKKCTFYLSVNVFSTKVLIGDTIFTSPNGDGTAILRGHPSHAKVSPLAVQRKYLHFSVILRPWVMVRPRESNPPPPALQSNALPTELILPRLLEAILQGSHERLKV